MLGTLGGTVLLLGIILLVSANWDQLSDGVKLGGFCLLLAGVHGAGFWITGTGRPYPNVAEALHFVGAGLVLAGIGLVAQIYHLDARPPDGAAMWLIAIVPLAVLLRSAAVTALSVFALLLWAHLEGNFGGSPLEMPDSILSHLSLEVGLGAALVGASPFLRDRVPAVARLFRGAGLGLLAGTLYLIGFYRHFSWSSTEHSLALPLAAIGTGAVALAVGARHLAPGLPIVRNRLVAFLGLLLALTLVLVLADCGAFPRGPKIDAFEFGWWRHYDAIEWLGTGCAWILWFALAGWCVTFGTHAGRRNYINVGVAAIALGVITRFFDLIGGLAETGTVFTLGGVVLLVIAAGAERWRRGLVARMEQAA